MPRDIKIKINKGSYQEPQEESKVASKNKLGKRTQTDCFKKFVDKVNRKSIKRKPTKTKPANLRGTLVAKRNKRIAIREGALRHVSILIRYKKVTTGEIKRYEVNPISYRYKKLKAGYRKVLFALDKKDKKQIKMFVLKNIQNVGLTNKKFKSNYPVEIK